MKKTNRFLTVLVMAAVILAAVFSAGCGRTEKQDPSEEQSGSFESGIETPASSEDPGSETPDDPSVVFDPTASTEESGSETIPEESETPEPDLTFTPGYRVKISEASVRIRSEANLECEVIGSAGEGDVFDVIGTEGSFYVIDFGGVKAYVHESVVRYGDFEFETDAESLTDDTGSNQPTAPSYVPSNNLVVCLDAGHKPGGGIAEKEPNAPGSSVMKAKLTTGTQGSADGVTYYEYAINGQVVEKLKAELEGRGYTVYTVDRNLSNAERAQFANSCGASVFLRIHCNGSDNHSVTGLLTYGPSAGNPYLGSELSAASIRLSDIVGRSTAAATGAKNLGILNGDDMTGINWCKIPVTIVEMGFMTNENESEDYQRKLAVGMANGVDEYLGR